jgi:hypothetical protein
MHGYLRDDGLWDVEAHLTDTKSFAFIDYRRGRMAPGDFIHDMTLRLTVDDDRVIRAIGVAMDDMPFDTCPEVAASLDGLIGRQIGAGWRELIREKVARTATCTHLAELLIPLASTVYQTIAFGKHPDEQPVLRAAGELHERPFFIDGCHSWRADGPVVLAIYPQFRRDKSER